MLEMYRAWKSARYRSFEVGTSVSGPPLDARHVELEEIRVDDNTSTEVPRSTLPMAILQPRPLNLADSFEVVGGVPTFVWRPSPGCNPRASKYSISSDGACIAVLEGRCKICVYDMLDNFSLIAKWEDTSHKDIYTFAFHNKQNNELVVVFWDTAVALLCMIIKSESVMEGSKYFPEQTRVMEVREEFRILENYTDKEELHLFIANEGFETWVVTWNYEVKNTITLTSITKEGLKRMHIKIRDETRGMVVYISISQKALMIVSTQMDGYKPLRTSLFHDIDFTNEVTEMVPKTIECGKSFGFSECRKYLLIWRYVESGEDAIEIYQVQSLKRSMNPITGRSLGPDVAYVRGYFIKNETTTVEFLEGNVQDCPNVAFVVMRVGHMSLTIWEPRTNKTLRELDLTMKEMRFSNPFYIEFCISPDEKWVATCCRTNGIFSLFSIFSKMQVWTIKLNVASRLSSTFIPLKFDSSSTKLLVNISNTLYVFFPPCLIENYHLEFQHTTYDLEQDFEEEMVSLSLCHHLIPKNILKQMLILKYKTSNRFIHWLLDVVSSKVTHALAFLFEFEGELLVIKESLKTMDTWIFRNSFIGNNAFGEALKGLRWICIDELVIKSPKSLHETKSAWIFLYPNEKKDEDLTVVFWSQGGFFGLFVDFSNVAQEHKACFSHEEPLTIKQSEDGNNLSCLFYFGVMVIDLKQRTTIYNTPYMINLAQWLDPYIRAKEQSFLDISSDGNCVSIGWSKKKGELLVLTSKTKEEECKALFEEDNSIVPCWCFSRDSMTIAFLQLAEDDQSILSIYKSLKRLDKARWNLHTKRVLNSIKMPNLYDYALQLDEVDGHLWIIVLHKGVDSDELVLTPINPYSLDDCTPCLYMLDYPTHNVMNLEKLASKFGHALSTMLFNETTNFQLALVNKDKTLMRRLLILVKIQGISTCALLLREFGKEVFKDLLNDLIEDKDEFKLVFLLDLIEEGIIPFEEGALMMEKGFQKLYLKYLALIEPRVIENSLAKKTCEIEIPIYVLTKEMNAPARMGTIDSIPIEWEEFIDHGIARAKWRSLHEDDLREIERSGSGATITALVTFFSIANVCKVGLNGLLRFLLMQEAPSYIFKAPLIKWVIEFKWKKVWKRHSFCSFMFYLIFMGLYSTYSIWIAFRGRVLGQDMVASVCLTILLFALMILAFILLYQEYVQMRTYIKDGKALFPNDPMWGLRKYTSSLWNFVEVLSCIMVILIIPSLYVANLFGIDMLSILFACIALESILIWIKVWYFAQAFERTGAFVLMIENIIKDCVPFLSLALVVLARFSFALFVLFQHTLQEEGLNDNEDSNEVRAIMQQSFGNPLKTMVTMFYAMIGTFEPQIYHNSGSLSFIIIAMFVVYLAIQMIVMVNMFIAIMGDTFDRVKSSEEDQLLIGRARFIDACEAQLSNKDIEALENSIGKYLYVLFPKDDTIIDDVKFWQGRVKTIEDRVGKMIKDSQKEVMKKTEGTNIDIKKNTSKLKEMREDTKKMKEDIAILKEMKDDTKQLKEDITEIKQILKTTIEKNEGEAPF